MWKLKSKKLLIGRLPILVKGTQNTYIFWLDRNTKNIINYIKFVYIYSLYFLHHILRWIHIILWHNNLIDKNKDTLR